MATDPLIDEALAVFDAQVPDAEEHRTTPTETEEAIEWHKKQIFNWMMTVQATAGGAAGTMAARTGQPPTPGGQPLPPGGMFNLKLNVGGKNGN